MNNNVLQAIDVNRTNMEQRSPARKRARYHQSPPPKDCWSLNNPVQLDEVYDYGVSLLESESDAYTEDEDEKGAKAKLGTSCDSLGGSTPKQDTQHISIEEWDGFLMKKSDIVQTKIDYFSSLSDEVILHIFHFLPKMHLRVIAAVCSRFQRLAADDSLWARIDASSRTLFAGSMGQILSRQVVILRLAQSEIRSPIIEHDSLAFSDTFQSRLLYLDMGMTKIDVDDLVLLFTKCHRLKKVSLEGVAINGRVLAALAQNIDIEVLNLAMVEGLDLSGLSQLLKKCQKLRELNIAWTYLDGTSIDFICTHLPNSLDRLNISGCRKLLSDTNVLELVNCCPGLRELDLSDCTGVTGDSIQHILRLQELNFLALSRCYQIPYRALLSLKEIESLLYLDLHGGYIDAMELRKIQEALGNHVQLNKFKFSSVARPTVGARRSSIWNQRVRD